MKPPSPPASIEKHLSTTSRHYNRLYLFLVVVTAAMGGLMFGYDWVVIGGAEIFYERYFGLTSASQIGWAMSSALIGALFGAIFSGAPSDRFGRKPLLLLSAFLFVITSIGTGVSSTFPIFLAFRLLGGVAIGIASNLSALYIAEVAPADMRGQLVSLNQLTISFGVVLAQIMNLLIARPTPAGVAADQLSVESWNVQAGWRWMFAVTAVPALCFLVGMFFAPESPRWLAKRGRTDDSIRILAKIGGRSYAQAAVAEIEGTLQGDAPRVRYGEIFRPPLLRIIILGIILAVLQQWCGINIIFQYGARVFAEAGYAVSGILFNIVITGVASVVMTIGAILTVDRWGRRAMMLTGTLGLGIIYLATGWAYHRAIHGVLPVVLVVSAIACYCYTLAPVTWVLLSELFPNRIRGVAMSISVMALWIGNFVLAQTFPVLFKKIGLANCFWIYGAICWAGFAIIFVQLPETKGKSLEQIEQQLVGSAAEI